jgi:hypothetical protein
LNPELKLWAIFKTFNARNTFHHFKIVPAANAYQASFPAAPAERGVHAASTPICQHA